MSLYKARAAKGKKSKSNLLQTIKARQTKAQINNRCNDTNTRVTLLNQAKQIKKLQAENAKLKSQLGRYKARVANDVSRESTTDKLEQIHNSIRNIMSEMKMSTNDTSYNRYM